MRAITIIDGSNFYYKLKQLQLPNKKNFDYHSFIQTIITPYELQSWYFAIGKIRALQSDVKARAMMADQQQLVTRLVKQGCIVQFGYLLKSDHQYHEKGVDIQLAVNLLRGAYRDEYDKAFLVSSDSDLLPAITEVQSLGKTVVYVGFSEKPSFALLKTCKESKLLTIQELLAFTSPTT